ncbi:hypothetical protein IGS68_11210 [Skermanella sp. TT6]|uniref:General secretion pathway protein M n=1 Tax=Skermanella cutis TaxID=2775420 RepID=A0ABX7BEN6_9PROT|nr:type II secretion system protein GspM [Skermanella sp. TT6]QQP91728.1 hypothetical protein IGS68_11210 [Skermanella sp. TT6]
MNTLTISPRLSKLLALTILVSLVMGSVNLVVIPLLDRFEAAQARLADAAAWRARLTAAVQRIPVLEQTLQETQDAAGSRKGILRIENEALGSAEFQKLIQKLVAESGIQQRSIQPVPARREHDAVQLGIRVTAAGDEASLARLLGAVQQHDPSLAVRSLHIAADSSRGDPSAEAPRIDIQADFDILAIEDRKE